MHIRLQRDNFVNLPLNGHWWQIWGWGKRSPVFYFVITFVWEQFRNSFGVMNGFGCTLLAQGCKFHKLSRKTKRNEVKLWRGKTVNSSFSLRQLTLFFFQNSFFKSIVICIILLSLFILEKKTLTKKINFLFCTASFSKKRKKSENEWLTSKLDDFKSSTKNLNHTKYDASQVAHLIESDLTTHNNNKTAHISLCIYIFIDMPKTITSTNHRIFFFFFFFNTKWKTVRGAEWKRKTKVSCRAYNCHSTSMFDILLLILRWL